VNYEGSGDMYYKGANMLHMIRQIVNNDEKWHEILLGLNIDFYHKVVDTKTIENYLIQKSGLDLKPVFEQYLRNVKIPILEYSIKKRKLNFRWTNSIDQFEMPVKIYIDSVETWIKPATDWDNLKLKKKNPKIEIDKNFYIQSKLVEI
jgi:aminopeptidase N